MEFVSLFVGKLVDFIAAPVGRQFSYLFRYNANLENYENQLGGLKMAGNDMKLRVEAAKRNGEVILPGVEDWLKKVGEASDESDRFIREEDAISKCCFNGPLNLKVRYQRSRKAKKKAAEFDTIKKDGRFDSVSVHAPPLPIGSMNNENEFHFESRRSIFNQIMEAIKDDGVGMIGIWGMPGIGKTTLVKRAAKYARDEGLFQEVAMAVVSQNPNFQSIQSQIADMIGLKFERESEKGRANQLLQRLLAMKKILIILDDIWESIELNAIGIPSGSQHKGCKLILTSRIRGVCQEMGTEKNFTIDLLSENEALNLFLKMSGGDDRCSDVRPLAEKLSEECGRLPISIVIVARGLLNKPKVSWEDMLNRLGNSDPEEKVRASIKLSYDNLSREEEQMFFLLCAFFPEDYKIPVQVLFEYGFGLNLFKSVHNVDEAVIRAQNLALRLKSQCLLLDEGDENFVKMHDVIRDVALAIASEGEHAFLVPEKTATSFWSDDVKKLPDVLECPQLQILILHSSYPFLVLRDNFFARMKNLIVLDMSFMRFERLPQSLTALENLRTLCFSNCDFGVISAIGKLQNLVCLGFYGSFFNEFPKEVGELRNLRLLELWECQSLNTITPGVIQNLSQLEVLRLGDGRLDDLPYARCYLHDASLSDFIHLSRLMILEICIPGGSILRDDVLFENLTKFKLTIGKDGDYSCMSRTGTRYFKYVPKCQNIFFSSSPSLELTNVSKDMLLKAGIKKMMKKAQHLDLAGISGIYAALPSHLGGYGSLKELIINHCLDVNYVLDMIKLEYEPDTPSLQLLHLINLPLLKEIIKGEFSSLIFSKLEHLELFNLPSLIHLWPFQAESNLTTMTVVLCNKLEYVFEQITAKSLLKLKKLIVEECRNLQAIYLSKEEEQDNVIVFPQLSHLTLCELENLTSFGSKFTSVIFLALEKLNINHLEKLEKIWHIHTPVESFFQLKVLNLTQCPGLVVVFPPQATSGLRNLEEICIENCHKLEALFQLDDVPFTVGDEMTLFPRLLTLKLVNLPKLTAILSTTSQNIFQTMVMFPAMKIMTLCKLHNLEFIMDQYGGFPSLTSLNFFSCNGVKSLLSPRAFSCLLQLEQLFVSECETMESIVGETSGEQNLNKAIEFSKLCTLKLCNLPRLANFYNRECALKFPSLRDVFIQHCPKLKTFASMSRKTPETSCQNFVSEEALFGRQVSFGRLSHLVLERLESMEKIWQCGHPATVVGQLIKLRVKGCDRLLKLFPSNLLAGLLNLNELHVQSCKSLEHVFEVEDHPPLLSNLQRLELYDLPELKQLWWNKSTRESFGLPKLSYLKINTCPTLQFIFDSSIANRLGNLETLVVENCSSILTIVAEKPGKKIEFPLLVGPYLNNLPRFKGSIWRRICPFVSRHPVHREYGLYF